ncbi:MAG TPA: hypothetical protein PKY82_09710 [Pyrinomonadaceae bacterium]|nr:hypothetical protein [Pyrinomonadaceae bacterium]
MKNLLLLVVLVFTFGTLANAQSGKQIAVHISFDFYVQNQKLTAGDYFIESVSPQSNQSTLIFRQKDGKAKKILMTIPIELKDDRKSFEPTMLFNRYGEEYFLAEIRNPLERLGFGLTATKSEKSLAKRFGKPIQETVAMSSVKK